MTHMRGKEEGCVLVRKIKIKKELRTMWKMYQTTAGGDFLIKTKTCTYQNRFKFVCSAIGIRKINQKEKQTNRIQEGAHPLHNRANASNNAPANSQ